MANTFTSSFTGNIVRDPERPHENILKFTVANNYRTKQDGEWTEEANFIDCVVFGARVEGLSGILAKGTKVGVVARMETDRWQNAEGENRSKPQFVASEIELLSPKGDKAPKSDMPTSDEPLAGKEPAGDDDIPF